MQNALSNFVRRLRSRRTLAIAGLLAIVALVTGCSISSSSPANALAENQKILATCDSAHRPAAWVAIDGTGSSAGRALFEERMRALQSIVQQTAVCGGYLKVVVFTSSSAGTTVLFDGSLAQAGATKNARLQRVPRAVADTVATIRQAYGPAETTMDQHDSDITAQYFNAAQWFSQLGGSYHLHLIVLTDGFQTAGINLAVPALSTQQAITLAQQTAVPMLPGADITVAGLGRIAGAPPASDVVEGLVSFYNTLCQRMQAGRCEAVSDFQVAGW